MFLHRYNCKNSCWELTNNSSVLGLSNELQLEIQQRCCYFKNVAPDCVLLDLKLYPIQVVISLPLWIKLTIDQLLLFSLCNFSSLFSYVGHILVTNHFIDIFWLFAKLKHTRSVDAAITPKMPDGLNEHTSCANTTVQNVFDTNNVHYQSQK